MNCYREPDNPSRKKIKFESDLSNYATKSELKKSGINTLDFVNKDDLDSLMLDVDKLGINWLKTVLTNLSKLYNAVDNDFV